MVSKLYLPQNVSTVKIFFLLKVSFTSQKCYQRDSGDYPRTSTINTLWDLKCSNNAMSVTIINSKFCYHSRNEVKLREILTNCLPRTWESPAVSPGYRACHLWQGLSGALTKHWIMKRLKWNTWSDFHQTAKRFLTKIYAIINLF